MGTLAANWAKFCRENYNASPETVELANLVSVWLPELLKAFHGKARIENIMTKGARVQLRKAGILHHTGGLKGYRIDMDKIDELLHVIKQKS